MDFLNKNNFNSAPPNRMHVDINSCFATIEQLYNPLLQGKPVVVAAYNSDRGVILASSKEAKVLKIKTGMRIEAAKKIYQELIVVEPDTDKYRYIHRQLKNILKKYSPTVVAKSIDEFAINFEGIEANMMEKAVDIKNEIAEVIGKWLTVSIGISTNRFLAKTASNIIKPDGLTKIDLSNFEKIYSKLKLTDLNGINWRTELRLKIAGIETVTDFYQSSREKLKSTFKSILAQYWYWRLRGYEIDGKPEELKKSYNNIYSLKNKTTDRNEILAILFQLSMKAGRKLWRKKRMATGIDLWMQTDTGDRHRVSQIKSGMVNGWEIYQKVDKILPPNIDQPIRRIAIYIFNLKSARFVQDNFFDNRKKYLTLTNTADLINEKFGRGTVSIGHTLQKNLMPEFIGFGQTK